MCFVLSTKGFKNYSQKAVEKKKKRESLSLEPAEAQLPRPFPPSLARPTARPSIFPAAEPAQPRAPLSPPLLWLTVGTHSFSLPVRLTSGPHLAALVSLLSPWASRTRPRVRLRFPSRNRRDFSCLFCANRDSIRPLASLRASSFHPRHESQALAASSSISPRNFPPPRVTPTPCPLSARAKALGKFAVSSSSRWCFSFGFWCTVVRKPRPPASPSMAPPWGALLRPAAGHPFPNSDLSRPRLI